MSKKIALIGFGGTIAMVPNKQGTLVPATTAEELVTHAPGLRSLSAELDVIDLLNKDSSNLTPKDWQLLITKIGELQSKYDGIIVTHGTDTMPYTATATAFAFGAKLSIPIIFTGSQLPMIEPGTDARVNLERAMRVVLQAIEENICEVMIAFSDRVLRASRSIKTSEARFDAFDSPAFPHIADISATGVAFSLLASKRSSAGDNESVQPRADFANGVISIDIRPGLDPDVIKSMVDNDSCEALILKSLGAGNIPAEGKYSFLPLVEAVVKSGKPVIIATKFVGGKTVPELYEPGQAALRVGAGHSGNMTDVAAEVKLMWLIAQGIRDPKEINRAMLKPYAGEVDSA